MQTEMDRVDRIIYNDEYRRLMETVRNKETDRISVGMDLSTAWMLPG